MSARLRILQILNGHEASRIRFSFPMGGTNITVSSHTFHRVLRAIRHDHIHVEVTTALRQGIAAEYDPFTDTMYVRGVIGRKHEGVVLHECTHAFFDIERTYIDALHDEAAAYLVSVMYYRMTGRPSPAGRPGWKNSSLLSEAVVVADALLQDYQRGTTAVPAVNAAAWADLMSAIRHHPEYRHKSPGTGRSYLHDGVH
jgi:hypothetical protein